MQKLQETYQLKIISDVSKNDIVFYSIKVINTKTKLQWEFVERYKNLFLLNAKIATLSKTIPQFPPKKLFGNMDPEFITQRKAALQNYFKTLLSHVDVDEIQPLKAFLTRGQPKSLNESAAQQQNQPPSNVLQQSQVMKAKIVKSEYDKITNDTNAKFIDMGFMMNAPEEIDIEKKRHLYDQVKVDHKVTIMIKHMKHTEVHRKEIMKNPDSILLMANLTLNQADPEFFALLSRCQQEVDKALACLT